MHCFPYHLLTYLLSTDRSVLFLYVFRQFIFLCISFLHDGTLNLMLSLYLAQGGVDILTKKIIWDHSVDNIMYRI